MIMICNNIKKATKQLQAVVERHKLCSCYAGVHDITQNTFAPTLTLISWVTAITVVCVYINDFY